MSRLSSKVVIWPNPILRQKAEQVTEFNTELTQLVIDMMLVLKSAKGVGLSACQVGDKRSLFVYKMKDEEGVMMNPEIIAHNEEMITQPEGCLSFPGVYIKVPRYEEVVVTFQDEEGEQHTKELSGLLGTCIQHEIDHLNGKTILDQLSQLKRDLVTRKMAKLQRQLKRQKNAYQSPLAISP